jgi:hypothetical protein
MEEQTVLRKLIVVAAVSATVLGLSASVATAATTPVLPFPAAFPTSPLLCFFIACPAAPAAVDPPADSSFLCYSKLQVDPGVWPDKTTNGETTAPQLIAAGYWKPVAEKSIPTNTKLPQGWYLHCNPPVATAQGAAPAPSAFVGEAGELITNGTDLATRPSVYPVAP